MDARPELYTFVMSSSVGMICWPAVECPVCHRMHAFFRNRDGKTRCLDCDVKNERQRGKT